jgi:Uma2 family endonuclease
MGIEANRRIKFRYEDYKSLPESETRRYELLDGELVMVPSPSEYHQRLSCNLAFLLWQYIKKQDLGRIYHAPLDVVLGEGSRREIVQPDILFIAKDRYSIITAAEIQGAPDLVIEILSPATAERDRTYKSTSYARYGVKEYWLVDPDTRTIAVLILGAQGFDLFATYCDHDVLQSSLLQGLCIDLREVF